jgi:hypothetical protein
MAGEMNMDAEVGRDGEVGFKVKEGIEMVPGTVYFVDGKI